MKFQIIYFDRVFNETSLCLAVEKENLDIIKLLLMNDKIDINIINEIYLFKFYLNAYSYKSKITALYLAIEKENLDIIRVLLTNNKLDPNIINIINEIFKTNIFNDIYIYIYE